MKIMKFGGACLATPEKMKEVANIIKSRPGKKIIVLSAIAGASNTLNKIDASLANNDRVEAEDTIEALRNKLYEFADKLLDDADIAAETKAELDRSFNFLNMFTAISYNPNLGHDILSVGEQLSTTLFSNLLKQNNILHKTVNAFEFMKFDKFNEPQLGTIRVRLSQLIGESVDNVTYLTQGQIIKNNKGETENLKQGGSDYSAALIAAALNADVCEIWTDIDAISNIDPSIDSNASPIARMSFDEAAELAYFGEKILHPASIWPAQMNNIPVVVKNVCCPDADGTIITPVAETTGISAIASRDNITALKIKSNKMLLAYGFMKRVLETFEKNKTAVDMISTSEVAVMLTIDKENNLSNILKELESFSTVAVVPDQAKIILVGNKLHSGSLLLSKTFNALGAIDVSMICFGASEHNLSILVNNLDKTNALKALNQAMFN